MKWYSWINELLSCVGLAVGLDLTQTKEILGLVLVILNVVTLLISLGLKFVKWFRESFKDRKIDDKEKEELDELIDVSVEELDEHIKGEKHK